MKKVYFIPMITLFFVLFFPHEIYRVLDLITEGRGRFSPVVEQHLAPGGDIDIKFSVPRSGYYEFGFNIDKEGQFVTELKDINLAGEVTVYNSENDVVISSQINSPIHYRIFGDSLGAKSSLKRVVLFVIPINTVLDGDSFRIKFKLERAESGEYFDNAYVSISAVY